VSSSNNAKDSNVVFIDISLSQWRTILGPSWYRVIYVPTNNDEAATLGRCL